MAGLLSPGTMRELLSARIAHRLATGLPVLPVPQAAPADTLGLSAAAQARIAGARPFGAEETAALAAARSAARASEGGEAYRALGRRADVLRAWQAAGGS
ncbi:MAG: hypothetical protein RMK81_10820, partial [Geminicoccaceae bacterium]|nr:hypothetical protein [Geminicoccaceae bacterium]